MTNMLIADDNKQILSILSEYAKKENYNVYIAYDGEEALDVFNNQVIDIVLLDVMMPKKDGFQVCRQIRTTSNVPVIMITARGEDFEKIMGLDIGADDYIVKPFSPGEVFARIRSLLRRMDFQRDPEESKQRVSIDTMVLSLENFQCTISGQPIPLTKKEFELFWLFSNHPNQLFTRDHLLDIVWGYDYFGDNRTVDSHIKRLRSKLDQVPHENWEISTVWGMGYRLEVF